MKVDGQQLLETFRRYLHDHSLPVTHQRLAVAEAIFCSGEHLSAEEIAGRVAKRGGPVGTATVYRTLELLVGSGLVKEHDFGEGFKRYEHLFGQQPVRVHLVCTECGNVAEIHSSELVRVQEEEARRHGFLPARYRLQIYGLCAGCQSAGVELKWEGLSCPIETV